MTNSSGQPRRPVIVGLGELLWDIKPHGRYVGGAPANFAYHANQFDADGVVVSCVGRDADGAEIMERLAERGMTTDFVRYDECHSTGTATVEMDDAGHHAFIIHTGVAWDYLPFDSELEALACQADAVCFGTLAQRGELSRKSIRAFLKRTRRDCLRVFDINMRQEYYDFDSITRSLAVADVLKLNDEEMPKLTALLGLSRFESEAVPNLMHRFGLRMVALTRGENGSVLYTKHRLSENRGVAPDALVDTVGAGDAFTAALVCGLLRYEDLDRLHERASRLAGFVCSQPGATPDTHAFLSLLA